MSKTLHRKRRFHFAITLFIAFLTHASITIADVRLPGFFGDHMVLQQGKEIRIWGWADSGESVEVTFGDHSSKGNANGQGKWTLTLPAQQANDDPQSLKVSGQNDLEIKDILIGEVWLCSGQSNMEWTVAGSSNASSETASANYPLIRHMKVAHRQSTKPLDDIESKWQICSPDTVGNFTAVGYFMARKLHEELDVPVGLINSSWGGTRVEPWTPPSGFAEVAALSDIYTSIVKRTPGSDKYAAELNRHIAATEEWVKAAKASRKNQTELQPSPEYPSELTPFQSHQDPTMLYNGMIHALVGFPMRGAIWYQGESNHTEGMLYFEKKKALINGWRKLWRQGDFPFYYVQIAPFNYGNEDPAILADFWEAQAAVEQLANTQMVVINDIATLDNIHPPNKQDVGARLAAIALKNDYCRSEIIAGSPVFDSLSVGDKNLQLTFQNTGGGLKTRDGEPATHFEVIGKASGGFQPASAELSGDTVTLSSSAVPSPVAFRFAWHKLAEPNLIGESGMPVGAFRGGDVPDFFNTVPDASDYDLVYDIDLNTLNRGVNYSVDKSNSVDKFDRVAYLLELNSEAYGAQSVFVSAKAFTHDAGKIAIPTAESGAKFQQELEELIVYSTADDLNTVDSPVKGWMEFWPNNYAPGNNKSVPNASDDVYDCGDEPSAPTKGYGSMQIHHPADKETIFAINHWNQPEGTDIGIGNSEGNTRDWTFTGNAASYSTKRLRVYVRPSER